MADLSTLTDEELQRLYGANAPAPQPAALSSLSDEELQALRAGSQPPSKSSYGEDVKALAADPLGVAWKDVKAIPSDIVEGVKALGSRAVEDVQNPRQGLGDMISILQKLNPITGTMRMLQGAAADPEGTARSVADPARPVSSILNAATVGSGGAATAGRGALKAASTVGSGADWLAGLPVSLLSGMSHDIQALASGAGKLGGKPAAALKRTMRGGHGGEAVVDKAQDALKTMQDKASRDYLTGRTTWGDPNMYLDTAPVKQSIRDARRNFSFGGVADTDSVVNALDQAEDIVRKRLNRPVPANAPVATPPQPAAPPQTLLVNPKQTSPTMFGVSSISQGANPLRPQIKTVAPANSNVPGPQLAPQPYGPAPSPHYNPLGMDRLKQELDTLMYDKNVAPQGSKARAAVGQVAGSVRDELRKNAPGYADEMEIAGKNIREIKEIRKTLSLGEKSSVDAALAKLQSTLRNDVSSRFGFRKKSLMDKLAKHDPELPYELAGQALGTWLPRGITGRVAEAGNILAHAQLGGLAGAAGFMSPSFLLPLAASIPRLIGEGRYAAGSTVRGARKIGATQKNLGRVGEAGRINSLFYDEDEEEKR